MGVLLGCGTGMGIGHLALRAVTARLNLPLIFSTSAAGVEVLLSLTLYSTFTLISSLRAIRIEPSIALHAE
jgi:ABC-type antimicrobial peptide transport system permease subunit